MQALAFPTVKYLYLAPELLLTGVAILVLLLDLFVWRGRSRILAGVSVAGLLGAMLLLVPLMNVRGSTLYGSMIVDPLAIFFKFFILLTTVLIVVLSTDYMEKMSKVAVGEFYTLILFATVGAMFMASTADLVMIYIALELTSLSCYVCAGYRKHDAKSNESILKYFLLGLLASAMMLYGFSLIYGFTGHTQLADIARTLSGQPTQLAVVAGIVFALAGFIFKVGSVPLHQWIPDVYEGAPTPVTAFLAVAPKAAALAALMRILMIGFPIHAFTQYWHFLFIVLSIGSMFLGNLLAIQQTNIKRMLGYSSIAHAGYIIMAFGVGSQLALQGILIYIGAYAFITVGAFAVVIALSDVSEGDDIVDYDGLSKRSPFLAAAMAVFMLALAGLPPTAGLWGKYQVFYAAVAQDLWWLALIGLINSVISLYYYFNVVRHIYLLKPIEEQELSIPPLFKTVVWVTLAGTLLLGVYPQYLFKAATEAVKVF